MTKQVFFHATIIIRINLNVTFSGKKHQFRPGLLGQHGSLNVWDVGFRVMYIF
jgi:hypothetical protein